MLINALNFLQETFSLQIWKKKKEIKKTIFLKGKNILKNM